MKYKKLVVTICILLMSLGISGFSLAQKGQQIKLGETSEGAVGNVVNLAQGWTENGQQSFYFIDQGSRLMPYAWFLALERASSEELFRSDNHINALRYLPSKPTKLNPDGLPIGVTKNIDNNGKEWMGFNCALCHTGQISYNNTDIRIDGGSTLGDVQTLQIELVEALKATSENDEKFNRFAQKVLGKRADEEDLTKLHNDLVAQTQSIEHYNKINYSGYPDQPHYGFARVDAIGSIFNQIMVTFNDVPTNARKSDAPVSYPFIWGTNESDVVQWPGFSPNGPASLGTLLRNGGEVLGVFGQIEIPEDKLVTSYDSSLNIKNLGKIEKLVSELRSPQWPEEYLPPINVEMAAKGEEHYRQNCLQCHQLVSPQQQGIPYQANLIPVTEVKTDPTELVNMSRKLEAGKFEGRIGAFPNLELIPAQTTGLNPLVNSVIGALLKHPLETAEAAEIEFTGTLEAEQSSVKARFKSKEEVFAELEDVFTEYGELFEALQLQSISTGQSASQRSLYKARPLNGIWATAPYLHNGSIPNLYELLLPEEMRSPTFYVGNREINPEKVGYVSDSEKSDIPLFKFDTSLKGNSNKGHQYGVKELSDEQKKELIEYLKTL